MYKRGRPPYTNQNWLEKACNIFRFGQWPRACKSCMWVGVDRYEGVGSLMLYATSIIPHYTQSDSCDLDAYIYHRFLSYIYPSSCTNGAVPLTRLKRNYTHTVLTNNDNNNNNNNIPQNQLKVNENAFMKTE